MDPELNQEIDRLERAVAELAEASRRALGFARTVEYQGITFLISRQMVIPDLTPLGYLQLVEALDVADDPADPAIAEAAVRRLYERIAPLLLCHHEWTTLKRADDQPVRRLERPDGSGQASTCKHCTAYAFGHPLPTIGRA